MSPRITACVITYNHERFIGAALDSVLGQKTSYPFDVVVADDHSQDGTLEVVRAAQRRHPGKIRVIAQPSNVGGTRNFLDMMAAATGEYVAYCDGDDRWSTEHKLQRQVDFLAANPGCSACFGAADIIDAEGVKVADYQDVYAYAPPGEYDEDYILRHGLGAPMSSLVFRLDAWRRLPPWFYEFPTHEALMLSISRHGPIAFLGEVLTEYRLHANSAWSSQRVGVQVAVSLRTAKGICSDPRFHDRRGPVEQHVARLAAAALRDAASQRSAAAVRSALYKVLLAPPLAPRYYAYLLTGSARLAPAFVRRRLARRA